MIGDRWLQPATPGGHVIALKVKVNGGRMEDFLRLDPDEGYHDCEAFIEAVRHEYFRRLLCGMIGADVEAGLIPADAKALGTLVEGICYKNAAGFFDLKTAKF